MWTENEIIVTNQILRKELSKPFKKRDQNLISKLEIKRNEHIKVASDLINKKQEVSQ